MPIFKINLGLNYLIWNVSDTLSWKKKTIKPYMINFLNFKRRSIEIVPTLLIFVKIITKTPQPLLSGHLYTANSIRWPNKIKLKMVAFLLFSLLLSLVLICRRHTWDTVTAYVNIYRRIDNLSQALTAGLPAKLSWVACDENFFKWTSPADAKYWSKTKTNRSILEGGIVEIALIRFVFLILRWRQKKKLVFTFIR